MPRFKIVVAATRRVKSKMFWLKYVGPQGGCESVVFDEW